MPELRQNIVTRDWVIIATERARRPDAFAVKRHDATPAPRLDPTCPFCPGHEGDTAAEHGRVDGPEGWRIRVIANKFPALVREGLPMRKLNGIYRSMNAVGYHEVVIENRRHDLHLHEAPVDDLAEVLGVYRRRYQELRSDPRIEAVVIFRNHGAGAGTSQPHPHSQIVATPIVPSQVRNRLEIAVRYFDETGECVFCRTARDERSVADRVICTNRNFVAFIPYAALSPFHLWVFPLRHMSSFDASTDEELADLAEILRTLLGKLYTGLNDPDYNLLIRSLPVRMVQSDSFHWYISIVPRISVAAGFEMGSGIFINPAIPEESARFLRDVIPEH